MAIWMQDDTKHRHTAKKTRHSQSVSQHQHRFIRNPSDKWHATWITKKRRRPEDNQQSHKEVQDKMLVVSTLTIQHSMRDVAGDATPHLLQIGLIRFKESIWRHQYELCHNTQSVNKCR